MERNRSIQRADSSIPRSLEDGGRKAKRVPSPLRSGSGPPIIDRVWPMQDCRDRALPSRHQPPLPPPSPPSQLINPLVMARFAILRGQRGSVADSGVARDSSSDVCRETRPPPPGRPARPCGLHTHLSSPCRCHWTPPRPHPAMFPCALCSCRRSLGTGSAWADGSVVCYSAPPRASPMAFLLGWEAQYVPMEESTHISERSPRVHARTRTRQWPARSLDRREQAPRLPDAGHGARAAGCGLRA